jgi:large conductance mechanosensitive channel
LGCTPDTKEAEVFASIGKEFRDFINRGSVMDLAVAVIIGAAFGAVVTSFTNDIFGGLLGAIGGQPTVGDFTLSLGAGEIRWGRFLNALISFLIVAFTLFLLVKGINSLQRIGRRQPEAPASEAAMETEIDLLRDILTELRRGTEPPGVTPPTNPSPK